ncbi:uncharacterized protein LOC110982163 [Acanthaster planci]|uniref:Uncharacterized protein LOC110982163 n=1 Tax=Acanthaster planci TaxID=133434 RepID=A0A8B7YS46_ACAPL|nr:uncharacterized protein LOC110982163 [Acanthaster planci]
MSYLQPPPAQHTKLLDKISRALTDEDVPRFKNRCLAEGIRPGELERKSVLELLQLLDRRRVIAPGKYDHLVLLLTDIDRGDLVQDFFTPEGEQETCVVSAPAPCNRGTDDHHHPQHRPPSASMNSVISDKGLSWLASKMGSDWEQVGMQCFGMSKNDIFQCKADNPHSVQNQIFSMLHKWKCRSGYKATYAQLLNMLAEFPDFDKTILEEMHEKIPSF